uniref:Nucleoporin NDC1 n=1 Tax=Denticeps clupeoides TaxID=299321 RepID=A0AAY4BGL4_9TELE
MFSVKQSSWFMHKVSSLYIPACPRDSRVVRWRAVASFAWSVLLLPVTTSLFVFLSQASLLHPIQWITDSLCLLTASSTMFSLLLLSAVVLVIGIFIQEYCTVIPSIPCSRVALLAKVLHPRQCVHSLSHCSLGMLVTWCAAVTIGGRYRTLSHPCSESRLGFSENVGQMCLNEYHLFLLLAGAFMGYSHSLLGVVQNMNYVAFHAVQQHKYMHFKGSLPRVVKCSAVQSLYSLRNYIVLYYFFGYGPRLWISQILNLQLDGSSHFLDTVAGLLDFSLLYHLWISGTFLMLTWFITVFLFRIYVSEAYSFPVQSTFTEDAEMCLPKVLSCKEPMVMKFLALQDLALLSQHSPVRRQEVFSLSQPGGHAHNWNAISRECLSLLTDLTQRLVAHHDAVASNGRPKSQGSSSDAKSVTSGTVEDLPKAYPSVSKTPGSVFLRSSTVGLNSPMTAPFTPDLDSPFSSPVIRRLTAQEDPASPWFGSVQSPHVMRRGPKLWSIYCENFLFFFFFFFFFIFQVYTNKLLIFFFLRAILRGVSLPEASGQALFADSQAHIWALEGLSHLVAASYTEDRFGVVQTTLPNILSSMLMLLEAVDRHFKLPHASSKPSRATCSMGDSTHKTLRFALRAALKTALYRITTTFGEHLHAVQMSAEHRKRMQQFLEYKE